MEDSGDCLKKTASRYHPTDSWRTVRRLMKKIARSNRREDVLSLQLGLERAWQPRDGSNVTYVHTSRAAVNLNHILARLEAENAQLRGSAVELLLQIQALRDGAT